MGGSEKSSSIVNSFSTLLLEVWEKWDVRGMVLFSLSLQFVLSFLGGRRKNKINPFSKIILWFAYLGADWIAIATLGKLSSSYTDSPSNNVLRAYWAPLLLLHLGGPDTITAYSFEDNKLWIRHLLILVVKAILVIYLICMSWTFSWLSFLSLPLILAGIIKYIEKILCLKLNNSRKTNPIISSYASSGFESIQKENPNVLYGYLYFTTMRPDVNDYLSSLGTSDLGVKIRTYLKETTGQKGWDAYQEVKNYFYKALGEIFEAHAVQLGFMFDVVYTKVALIYTKLGCSLRLISFLSSFSVLLLFFISIINEPKFHFSRVDIVITGILLSGAIALELFATWVMLSSDWAILVAEFHHNKMVRKMFKVSIKCFPRLLHQSKRWLEHMGQFDLLEYCLRHKKRKANRSRGILGKMTNWSEITEIWHKYMFTKFGEVRPFLKKVISYADLVEPIMYGEGIKKPTLNKALQMWSETDQNLKRSIESISYLIESDFDHSIIVWHLATSVCYFGLEDYHECEDMEDSKQVSDYMMYLLVMCPALILPEQDRSFWLDHTCDELKELLFPATDIKKAASTLVPHNVPAEGHESSESTGEIIQIDMAPAHQEQKDEYSEIKAEILQREVSKVVTILNQSGNKWKIIKDVWIEMLFSAAVSCPHISHIKHLGDGIEFLSFIWLFVCPDALVSSIGQPNN